MSATPDIIADLRRQLAECKAERDDALQQETATAEFLQVIDPLGSRTRSVYARSWGPQTADENKAGTEKTRERETPL